MKQARRWLSLALAVAMAFSCVSCGAPSNQEEAAALVQQEEVDLSQYAGMDLVKKLVELDRLPEARAVLETLDSPEAEHWKDCVLTYIPLEVVWSDDEIVTSYIDRDDWHGLLFEDSGDNTVRAESITLDEYGRATQIISTEDYAIGQIMVAEDGTFQYEGGLKVAHTRKFTYDERGNLLSRVSDKEEVTYVYDEVGRLVKETMLRINHGSRVTVEDTYTYDEQNRIVGIHREDAHPYEEELIIRDTTMTYDVAGHLLTRVEHEDGEEGICEEYTYDAAGRLLTYIERSKDEEIEKEEYTYDAEGNCVRVSKTHYSRGTTSVHTYTYDEQGRCLTDNSRTNKRTYTYDELGRVVKDVSKWFVEEGTREDINTYTYDGLYLTIENNGEYECRLKLGYFPNNNLPWWLIDDYDADDALHAKMNVPGWMQH